MSLPVTFLPLPQVMETDRMIYLVTEYASGGEIFGKYPVPQQSVGVACTVLSFPINNTPDCVCAAAWVPVTILVTIFV